MQKYKLINTKTKEEHLCDKVTIDGFDYYIDYKQPIEAGKWYISNQAPRLCVKVKDGQYPYIHLNKKGEEIADFHTWKGVIICSNNPNIDIPKIIIVKNCQCNLTLYPDQKEMCKDFCNNKLQETHPFSEEDMIEFAEWCRNSAVREFAYGIGETNNWELKSEQKIVTTKELLQLWKEQQPKIIYYG
jgi:hypothetical protein